MYRDYESYSNGPLSNGGKSSTIVALRSTSWAAGIHGRPYKSTNTSLEGVQLQGSCFWVREQLE